MNRFVVAGGNKLEGTIRVNGAKNAVLPILAATVLNGGKSVINDCPDLSDVCSTIEILKYLGCEVTRQGRTIIVDSSNIKNNYIPDNLMREMRSSIFFLGAIVSRMGKAIISYPGGCEIGPRPIDLHLKALKQLGITINEAHGYIYCNTDNIVSGDIHLDFPSVGATENIMLAAAVAQGTTIIRNAAKEPEINDLQDCLNEMGANISGAGTSVITIKGVAKLHDVEHTIIPDRIVASTYLAAAAIAGGTVEVTNTIAEHIRAVLSVFRECGCKVYTNKNSIILSRDSPLQPIDLIRTQPHPGFPTDMQAPIMSVLTLAKGASILTENIFESRFKHVEELRRMGADIKVDGRVAVIKGVEKLMGANVNAMDLRGGAALVLAGLAAEQTTEIQGIHHIDRGYEKLEDKLSLLGADIKRMD